ncbi:hypothetical protein [Maribacter sp.]|uniref:hypothetical protein n=1 Tax=Maribacter sp. TaxID=1897614 RepID=UPI003299FE8E
MKFFQTYLISIILLLVFTLGITHKLLSQYSDKVIIVFDTEQQDNQDESDLDEEILDIHIPPLEKKLLNSFFRPNNLIINTKQNLAFKIIEIFQFTPPPEYIG